LFPLSILRVWKKDGGLEDRGTLLAAARFVEHGNAAGEVRHNGCGRIAP
jgi:hypothetical protein